MKRFIRVIFLSALVLILIMTSAFSFSAAESSVLKTGKTLVEYGDWMLEKIDNDTHWSMDSYIGNDENVSVLRTVGGLSVIRLNNHCFANNTTVKKISVCSPLWTVGDYSMLNCTSLETFEVDYAFRAIGVGAFSGTTSLKNINLEDSVVTEIKPYTFANSGLETVKLPSTCTKLGAMSFAQCSSLNSVFIPDSVTEIADTAFYGCSGFTIYCAPNSYAAQYAEEHNINYITLGDVNGDNKVNIRDVTYIQLYLVDLYDLDANAFLRADVDRNGEVKIRDATYIQMYLVGLIKDFS